MKRYIRSIILLFATGAVLSSPVSVAAWDPFLNVDCNNNTSSASSAVCTDKAAGGNPVAGSNGIIIKVTDFIAFITGIVAIIMLMIGAIKYVTAGGDSKSVASAKSTIIYALIGLAVIVSATALITFIVSKL